MMSRSFYYDALIVILCKSQIRYDADLFFFVDALKIVLPRIDQLFG